MEAYDFYAYWNGREVAELWTVIAAITSTDDYRTLIAAVITYFIKNPLLSSIPTIVSNAVIVPIVLIMSGVGGVNMFPYFALTVGLGEVISCGILGTILAVYMKKHPRVSQALFKA